MKKIIQFLGNKEFHRIDLLAFSVSCFLAGKGYWWTASIVIWLSFVANCLYNIWLEREVERELEEIITNL